MITYHASTWAVRRWDWFNGGKQVQPQSFCQFWRTVILYATVKWVLLVLTFPVRPVFHRAVALGERYDAWEKRHKPGTERVAKGLGGFYGLAVVFVILAVLSGSWFMAGVLMGMAFATVLIGYVCIRTGILGLLWQVAVAVHHGICPPMEIER